MLSDLSSVLQTIRVLKSVGQKRLKNVFEVAVGQRAMPSSEALDKILRYETAVERIRIRAIEQLDRLQRRRMGEVVPPTLRVHLS